MRHLNQRQRGDETPSHPGGLSEVGKKRLEDYRRQREKQKGESTPPSVSSAPIDKTFSDGIAASEEKHSDGPRGLGDFQRRLNRDNRGNEGNRRDFDRGWDATPRSSRNPNADVSVRVPNQSWDATPRNPGRDEAGWGSVQSKRWDAPTPRVSRGGSPSDGAPLHLDTREWEEEQLRLDRDWYTGAEEGTLAGDEEHNPLAGYDDMERSREAEIAAKQVKKISARQAQYNADNDLWEANRMLTSGVVTRRTIDLDFEDDAESTVHVIVHDLKPPFLDGKTVFTKQLDPINPIRDPTSDMAVFSKKGSALVKEKREQAERAKAAAKLAALSGTSLGNIMGVKDEEAEGVFIPFLRALSIRHSR